MYLEALTTCVNYSDFLLLALHKNKKHFDNWVVVTTPEDDKTQALCKKYEVTCACTNAFSNNNVSFNKGAALNFGYEQLTKQDWILLIDADTILPSNTRQIVELQAKDESKLYGAPRLCCDRPGRVHRRVYNKQDGQASKDGKKGSIWGYFQLFHHSSKTSPFVNSPHAGVVDRRFAKLYKERGRQQQLDLEVLHVGPTRLNWEGRITPKFNLKIKGLDKSLPKGF